MSIELRPLGVKCNIQCQYCYQNPQRDAGNIAMSYDLDKMKAAILKEGGSFTLFGGEALMVPKSDLVDLWSWGLKKFGRNSIQTNGTLIDEEHMDLFEEYKVHVGISVDGPDELNDARWSGSLAKTREMTKRTHDSIDRLVQRRIPVSLIVTLHKANATADKLPAMHDWFRYIDDIGITSARIHILEIESNLIESKYALTKSENLEALLSFLKLEGKFQNLKLDVFQDVRNLLIGTDNSVTCVWNACDPYTTRAVKGIEGFGQLSNCGRTNKDGIDFVKSNTEGFERYLALYHTPQENGGCKDCRFFMMCKGQCPGTSIDNDWRNRTRDCDVWKEVFSRMEDVVEIDGKMPISKHPRRMELESYFLQSWANGNNTNISGALKNLSN
jgi:uncharacterized protein